MMNRKFILAITMAAKQYLRNPLFIILLVGLPPIFITLSFIVTPDDPFSLRVPEGDQQIVQAVGMPDLHGAIMVPITVAFLAGILGMFVMFSARQGDRRLVLAGYHPMLLLSVRLVVITVMSIVITILSVGITLLSWQPEQLGLFFVSNLLPAIQYGYLGAIAGTYLSATSGTYLMFFLPMIDVGLIQNPMFPRQDVELWVKLLPDYAPMEVLIDTSFSAGFDTGTFLLSATLYAVVLAVVAAVLFRRAVSLRH